MSTKASPRHDSTGQSGDKTVSQVIFVTVALVIILAGVWTLDLGEAPYHPDDSVSRSDYGMSAD